MSNFEATAISLAAKSIESVSQIEELNTSLNSFEEIADGNFKALNSQFDELQEIVKSAIERLQILENNLTARLGKFGEDCSSTLEAITTTRSSYEEQHESAKRRAQESDEQVKVMVADQSQSWESVSERATALLEGYTNIQNHLATVTSEATGEITSQVVTMLTEIPSRLEAESSSFGEFVEVESITTMTEEASELTSKIEDISVNIKDVLQELGSLMEDGITETLGSMYSTYEETVSDLIETASDLADTFNNISDKVSDSVESAGEAFDTIDDVIDMTNIGLSSAFKVFEESKELLERII